MRKLKLELTELQVTSFETVRVNEGVGTVAGYKTAPPTELGGQTCQTCPGQGNTCEYQTCAQQSCAGSCAGCGGSYATDCAICLL